MVERVYGRLPLEDLRARLEASLGHMVARDAANDRNAGVTAPVHQAVLGGLPGRAVDAEVP